MSLQELVLESLRELRSRQQLLTANLTGNAFFGFIVYSWLSLNNLSFVNLRNSAAILIAVAFFATWLQATTFTAFHFGAEQSPYLPALRRLHCYLPWATALAGTVVLFTWMSSVLGSFVWVVGVGVILAVLPFASQAAGGGFPRQRAADIVFHRDYWIAGASLVVLGLWVPAAVVALIPVPAQPFPRMLISGMRLSFAYFLAIGAWVLLAAIIGRMGGLETLGAKPATVNNVVDSGLPEDLSARPFASDAGTVDRTSR